MMILRNCWLVNITTTVLDFLNHKTSRLSLSTTLEINQDRSLLLLLIFLDPSTTLRNLEKLIMNTKNVGRNG